ncbi:hypothetical protein F4777DRAFT_573569 [Nemania sp. FL0916]|nr:hypothetical protein F4777DRAFT_573569 [Nemania sp. FL0916]
MADGPGLGGAKRPNFTVLRPPGPPSGIYRYTATALGAGMWFFLMYRAKKDGISPNLYDASRDILTPWPGAVLMGWKHPWDH